MPTLELDTIERRWDQQEPLMLDSYTEITPEAAAMLVELPISLRLDGLAGLSEDVAEILAQREGLLSLNGLTEIPTEVANRLAYHQGGLSLNGLTSLSSKLADEFREFSGMLHLDGLTELEANIARRLIGNELRLLSLNGVSKVEPNLANALTRRVQFVRLDGLSTLSAACASDLRTSDLSLEGLLQLNDNVAQALVKSRNELDCLRLKGLRKLNDNAAATLSRCQGLLLLHGLTEISDFAIEKLAGGHCRIVLDRFVPTTDRARLAIHRSENLRFKDQSNLGFQSCLMDRLAENRIDAAMVSELINQRIERTCPQWKRINPSSYACADLAFSANDHNVSRTIRILFSREHGMCCARLYVDHDGCPYDRLEPGYCLATADSLSRDIVLIAKIVHDVIDADVTFSWEPQHFASRPTDAVKFSDGASIVFRKY